MALQPSLFLETIVRFLMPFFLGVTSDVDAARAEIIETLASYGARTRSEMLNAARIIAYGIAALATLGEASDPEMPASMRLRFRGCANGLDRSGQQNETALAKRLACDVPDAAAAPVEPVDDMADADVQAEITQARAKIDTCRNRLSGASPKPHAVPGSKQENNRRLWSGAMMDALAELGMPVQPISTG